jgi:hypothetical protein
MCALVSFCIIVFITPAFARDIPFTQDDRDRLIRLETRVDEGLRGVNQRIDSLENLMYVLISAIFIQTVGVVGFVLWDRRTALAPVVSKNRELEAREERMEQALKEMARHDKRLPRFCAKWGYYNTPSCCLLHLPRFIGYR